MRSDSQKERVEPRVLITGIGGFIGRLIRVALEERGAEVWGFDRYIKDNAPRVVECDLGESASIARSLRMIPPPDVVIHAAHLGNEGADLKSSPADQSPLAPFLRELEEIQPLFILLGSVAVYGERRHHGARSVHDEARPTTEYGRRKLSEERALEDSALKNYQILRLTPVYNEERPRNLVIRARPWPLPLKLYIFPEPRHSLCHIDTLVGSVLSIINARPIGRHVSIVCEPEPHSQHKIARMAFGLPLPLPIRLTRPIPFFLSLISGSRGESLRGYYWKLFGDTIFQPTKNYHSRSQ